MGWVVNATPRPLYPRERSIVKENGWAPGPVWTGAENLAPTVYLTVEYIFSFLSVLKFYVWFESFLSKE
jgi:hypothetical protein